MDSSSSSNWKRQKWKDVQALFKIDFKQLTKMPLALEDVFGGIIGDQLIFSCGFGGDIRKGAARQFYKNTYAVSVREILAGEMLNYQKLAKFPARARQKGASIVIGDDLYCWGGYNYEPCQNLTTAILSTKKKNPKAFRDGYAYSTKSGKWRRIVDLPDYRSSFSLTRIDGFVYLFGGCDYYDSSFNTWHDRNGENEGFGGRLYRIPDNKLELGRDSERGGGNKDGNWEKMPNYPGTPRMNHVGMEVGGDLFVIGGCTGRPHGGKCYSTVDNWVYRVALGKWERIRDTPTSNTNWQSAVVLEERYIVLVGGASTTNAGRNCHDRLVINAKKEESGSYGTHRKNVVKDCSGIMSGEILVYDTVENRFGRMDGVSPSKVPLLVNLNNPLVLLVGDGNSDNFLVVMGGEIEISGATRRQIRTKLHCYSADVMMFGKIERI